MSRERYRNVCFTSFGDEPNFEEHCMSYLIYGLEQAGSTGRQHWQGYVEFRTQLSRQRVRSLFPGAHIERRYGSALEAASYCAKDGEYCEHGSLSQPGERTDLTTVADSISTGAQSITDIACSAPSLFVRYGRGLSILSSVSSRKRQRLWRDIQFQCWWGDTGTGKTRTWFSQYGLEDSYRFKYNVGNDYWCGYEGQRNILFDEFESQVLLSNMLMYTDGHPLQLNTKFGHAYANWDTVTIISNSNPQTWYVNCSAERRRAFARRINCVIEYSGCSKIIDFNFAFDNILIGDL